VPYAERSMQSVGDQTSRVMFEKRVVASMMYLKMARTWGTLDASLAQLIPDANYTGLMRAYFRQARRRSLRKARRPGAARRSIREALGSAAENSLQMRSVLRRGALTFAGETGRFAFCLGTLIHGLRHGLAVVGVLWCLRAAEDRWGAWLPIGRGNALLSDLS